MRAPRRNRARRPSARLPRRRPPARGGARNEEWNMRRTALALIALTAVAGCGKSAHLPVESGIGPDPQLPPPHRELIPTVQVADVDRWPAGTKPTVAAGLEVAAFAEGLDHPRWLHVLPNGD